MILTDPEWQAVLLSLKVSSLAVLFSLPFGIFFAWLLVRCTFPGKALLDSVLHLPLVLPPVVVGYLLLVSMGRRGFIGERLYDWFGITFAFSWRGAVLAAAVMSFPLMVRAIRLALEGVDVKLEQAARTLGAGRWRVSSNSNSGAVSKARPIATRCFSPPDRLPGKRSSNGSMPKSATSLSN